MVSVGMSVDVRSERWGDAFVYDSGKQEYSIPGVEQYIFSLCRVYFSYIRGTFNYQTSYIRDPLLTPRKTSPSLTWLTDHVYNLTFPSPLYYTRIDYPPRLLSWTIERHRLCQNISLQTLLKSCSPERDTECTFRNL